MRTRMRSNSCSPTRTPYTLDFPMTHQSSRIILKLYAIWPTHTYKKWRQHSESLRIGDPVFTGTQTRKCFYEEIKSVPVPKHYRSFVALTGVPHLCKRSKLLAHGQNVLLWSCSFCTQEHVFNDQVETAHQLMMITPHLMKHRKLQKSPVMVIGFYIKITLTCNPNLGKCVVSPKWSYKRAASGSNHHCTFLSPTPGNVLSYSNSHSIYKVMPFWLA